MVVRTLRDTDPATDEEHTVHTITETQRSAREDEAANIAAWYAARIRQARRARGWTQGDLAERLGTVQSTVSAAEQPGHRLSLESMARFAAAFDTTIADLFGIHWQRTEPLEAPEERRTA